MNFAARHFKTILTHVALAALTLVVFAPVVRAATDAELDACIASYGSESVGLPSCCGGDPQLALLSRCAPYRPSGGGTTPTGGGTQPGFQACQLNNPGSAGLRQCCNQFPIEVQGNSGFKALCAPYTTTAGGGTTPTGGGTTPTGGGTTPTGGAGSGAIQQTSAFCGPGTTYKNGTCIPDDKVCNGGICKEDTVSGLILNVIKILLTLAGVIAVLFIILGGFWYLTSAGNTERAEKGKVALVNALIGLVLILMSYVIVRVVSGGFTSGV